MAYIIIAAIFGTAIGSGLTYLCMRSHWQKRLKVARQEVFDRYNTALNAEKEHKRLLEASSKSYLEEKNTLARNQSVLQAQIVTQQESYRQMKASYEKKLAAEQSAQLQLQQTHESQQEAAKAAARENVSLVLQQNETVEASNRVLEAKNSQLILANEQLQAMLQAEKMQHKEALKLAYRDPAINIGEIVRDLFPNLALLRDSVDEINRNKSDIVAILQQLKALDSKNFKQTKKIQATDKEWSECKIGMIRIYFRKESASPLNKCEVWVSRKKDDKSQDKDLDWLKKRPKKQ